MEKCIGSIDQANQKAKQDLIKKLRYARKQAYKLGLYSVQGYIEEALLKLEVN